MKKFIKENFRFLLLLTILFLVFRIELPYYIEAPGGTINLSKRIDEKYNRKNGSLNMLYVTEYKGNIVTVLLSKVIKNWDLYEIKNQQISNEDTHDIYIRNKIMLDNSTANATYVAYKQAGKEINITKKENVIIAVTKDNGFEIGDIVLTIDDLEVDNISTIKEYINTKKSGDKINIKIKRNKKEKNIETILDDDKILGIMMITNYQYDVDDDLNIAFKTGEGGSSGGLIISLGIYSEITGIDLLKGRNIAGTGTIDIDGNVGEIDGIKYKIAGAARKHMDIVLVSPDNYEEAKQVIDNNNYKIELVKVSTFEEAVAYLTK